MSNRESSQTRTEPPTRHRLKELRKRGNVARSADVGATVAIVASLALLMLGGARLLERLSGVLQRAVTADFNTLLQPASLLEWLRAMLLEVVWITLPLVLVLIVAGALAGFIQVGPVFAAEQVRPQLSRLDPVAGFRRMFSRRSLVELVKFLLKAALLGAVIWHAAASALPALLKSHWLPLAGLGSLARELLAVLGGWAVTCFSVIAAFDLWFQRFDFQRRNRMSIDEVRREHKETQGDPHIRGRRRQLHREITEAALLESVRRASVVVVNPTHIAVALYYEAGATDLPLVLAKGEGYLAQAIRRVAEQEGIPVMRDVDLARRLRSEAAVDQYIPEDLLEPVAAVLRWARDL